MSSKITFITVASTMIATASTYGLASNCGIVLTEYNAVGSDKWLANPNGSAYEGPGGENAVDPVTGEVVDNADTYFGRVQGNGGDWFEFVITVDNLDVRGWQIYWAELDETDANGVDYFWDGIGSGYGVDASIPHGIITFSESAAWSNLRAGTVLTISENPLDIAATDLSFDPCNGDWWINGNTLDSEYFTTVTNVTNDGEGPGNFDCGNDSMIIAVFDADGNMCMSWTGEGSDDWGGGGVNSREIMRLEQDPDSNTAAFDFYDDGKQSSFGSANRWSDAFTDCRTYGSIESVRADVIDECGCTAIILNEYNAVGNEDFLNGGDGVADEDGEFASDTYFGRQLANGGDWFEMVVIQDGLDMRGMILTWAESGEFSSTTGTIILSDDSSLANIPAGTIVTVIERPTAEGGLDSETDLTDGWINICTRDTSLVAETTSNDPDHVDFGDIKVNEDDWTLGISNWDGTPLMNPAGEGFVAYWRGGVSSENTCHLEMDIMGTHYSPNDAYDDSARGSTFGSVNRWRACPEDAWIEQTIDIDANCLAVVARGGCCIGSSCSLAIESACVSSGGSYLGDHTGCEDADCGPDCETGDVDCDGDADVDDLLLLLGAFGDCDDCSDCPTDFDGNCSTNVDDLLQLLSVYK
ncbi:MAG: hypothetical protein CMJ29_06250 [Phycisphaerae bacterium]|nr:hypothetical protein [Phycisphaerae bacterium]